MAENIHVLPHPDGGWQVKRNDSGKAVAIFKTKKEAMEKARSMSGRSDSNIVEHGADGTMKNITKSRQVDTDMTNVKVHVMPNPKGGWQVKREGSDKIIENFETKEEAMARGRKLCGNSDSHLVEHGADGTIMTVTKSRKVEKKPEKKKILGVIPAGSSKKPAKGKSTKTTTQKIKDAIPFIPKKKTEEKKTSTKAAPKKTCAKKTTVKATPKKTATKKK